MKKDLIVLFEDNQIIVVLKPQNVLSQSDETKDDDMLSRVKEYIKEKYNKKGNVFIGLVHRLDRPTGGIMVFARNSKSAARLSKQIAEHSFVKKYLTVVTGLVKAKDGILEDYLKKDEKNNLVKIVPMSEEGAKLAVLNYKILEKVDDLTLLEVNIKTGRTHQIRVQLANLKNVVWGDVKYGFKSKENVNLALWAYCLDFEHPTTKAKMKFKCLPPEDEMPWKVFKNFFERKV